MNCLVPGFMKLATHNSICHGFLSLLFLFGGVSLFFPADAFAQGERRQATESTDFDRMREQLPEIGKIPDDDQSELAVRYREKFQAWKDSLKEVWSVLFEYKVDQVSSNTEFAERWSKASKNDYQKMYEFRAAAIDLYDSDPKKYAAVGDLLYGMLVLSTEQDQFEATMPIAEVLIKNGYQADQLVSATQKAAIATASFGKIDELLSAYGVGGPSQEMVAAAKAQWQRELEFRREDAEKDDLPRVEILTTKGTMIVELFEDQAPEAVASFIYLVENGFYNRRVFFRVIKNAIAQVGCKRDDGSTSIGYSLPPEMDRPDRRHHFRGSLSVALSVDPESQIEDRKSGGSQIFFIFAPQPALDNKYTVFGRIIEGIECLGNFTVVDLSSGEKIAPDISPDAILRATVIRKRDHDYIPQIIDGELPFK